MSEIIMIPFSLLTFYVHVITSRVKVSACLIPIHYWRREIFVLFIIFIQVFFRMSSSLACFMTLFKSRNHLSLNLPQLSKENKTEDGFIAICFDFYPFSKGSIGRFNDFSQFCTSPTDHIFFESSPINHLMIKGLLGYPGLFNQLMSIVIYSFVYHVWDSIK